MLQITHYHNSECYGDCFLFMEDGIIFVSVRWFYTFSTKICFSPFLNSLTDSFVVTQVKLSMMTYTLPCTILFSLHYLLLSVQSLNKTSTTFFMKNQNMNNSLQYLEKVWSVKDKNYHKSITSTNTFIDSSLKSILLGRKIVSSITEITSLGLLKVCLKLLLLQLFCTLF